ncbi:MAG: DNA topoisomerase IV subunit A [Mycoplasmataceae bacterium]|nr:DNA topoisomerase IV subunit A [Mycoplasmataceae bacterium]
MSKNNLIHLKPIEEIMSESFGKYAKYIIQDRALPDIRDGLKPVQRRILYAMNSLQLFYDAPHKKSARTVGEVLGKYHPHGDSSIYEAMVRMSQDWKNNMPLLDMHGNNGSLDGDGAAAMRYTECRLSHFGQTMLEDIKKDTVQFINNFDDSEREPTVLPSLLPNLLINGASGIAAGYATNIPPFNVSEVIDAIITRIDSPTGYLSTILKVMPGPDFPTGAIILNPEGIRDAYETGKGKINIRAKIEQKTAKQVYITEIPYETNKSSIIRSIQELADKHDVLNISEVRDESDKNGVSITLDMKTGKNFEFVRNFLYKNTPLQISYNLNMVVIKNRKPFLMPMLSILDSFIEHIEQITISASCYDLNKTKARKEIVLGLIKAIKVLDDVVNLIRRSSDRASAKASLISKLMFSEAQAEAIVNLRLYRLSNNDVSSLNKELLELDEAIAQLDLLIKDKEYRDNYLKNKLRGFKKIFGTARKTQISHEEAKIEIDQNDVIEDRENIIVVTRDGYIKNISKRSYSNSEYDRLKLKEGDLPVAQFISNQRDKLILITAKGNYISIPTHKVETVTWNAMGVHLNNIIVNDPDDKIITAFNYTNNLEDSRCLIIASKQGMIKRTLVKDLGVSKLTKISTVMNLDEHDSVCSCAIVANSTNEAERIMVISKFGIALSYLTNQISVISRNAAGVKNITLRDNDEVAAIFVEEANKEFVLLACTQGMKRVRRELIPQGNRGNVGKSLISQIKSNPITVLNAFMTNMNETIHVVDISGVWSLVKSSEIVIGDVDTRVSALRGKQTLFATKVQPLGEEEHNDEAVTLFEK